MSDIVTINLCIFQASVKKMEFVLALEIALARSCRLILFKRMISNLATAEIQHNDLILTV